MDGQGDFLVDAETTTTVYKSPQADMGYDISDYKDIDPRYGTLEDVDRLITELKKYNMKLMMDLVVNHTSNQHNWFLESSKSKDNPKRDWYIWKAPKSDKKDANGIPEPPNNWAQILGDANPAWTYDKKSGEFYLSLFTPEQPDLNWENPEVREAVHGKFPGSYRMSTPVLSPIHNRCHALLVETRMFGISDGCHQYDFERSKFPRCTRCHTHPKVPTGRAILLQRSKNA